MIKTIAGIASIPSRKELLTLVVNSLLPQVDKICVALNGYSEIPESLRNLSNVECVILDNKLGDGAKFYFAQEPNVFYLSCDDDLSYPKDYVSYMTSKVKQYNCIISLHGRRFDRRPILSYRKSFTLNYHCLHTYHEDVVLHVGGTGVMCFNTSRFMPDISQFKEKNMADIWIAKQACEQGVPIMGVAHKNNYLTYLNPAETIWRTCKIDPYQTGILKSFLK